MKRTVHHREPLEGNSALFVSPIDSPVMTPGTGKVPCLTMAAWPNRSNDFSAMALVCISLSRLLKSHSGEPPRPWPKKEIPACPRDRLGQDNLSRIDWLTITSAPTVLNFTLTLQIDAHVPDIRLPQHEGLQKRVDHLSELQ